MAPMTRNRAGRGNAPGPLNATYYAQRASAGLIVSEATQISPQGVGYPGTPGIHSDEQIAGWKGVTNAVHAAGGRIFLQLWHVGRISHPSLQPGGAIPVAPSAIAPAGQAMTPDGMKPFVTPRALETEEVAGIVEDYRGAARNARMAGFDGVELHGANGYLIDQFLRDGSNRRTDRYGGTAQNRARLLIDVVETLVAEWGAERVGVRLSPTNPFNDMFDSNPAATFATAVGELDRFALAYLHIVEPAASDPVSDGEAPDIRFFRKLWRGALVANKGYRARQRRDPGRLGRFGVLRGSFSGQSRFADSFPSRRPLQPAGSQDVLWRHSRRIYRLSADRGLTWSLLPIVHQYLRRKPKSCDCDHVGPYEQAVHCHHG